MKLTSGTDTLAEITTATKMTLRLQKRVNGFLLHKVGEMQDLIPPLRSESEMKKLAGVVNMVNADTLRMLEQVKLHLNK